MEETKIAPDVEIQEYTLEEIEHAKEAIHEQRSKKKKTVTPNQHGEEPKQEVFTKRKSPEELRKMGYNERQRYYEWCRDRDKEKVRGVFRFFERPGGDLSFPYKAYKGEGFETYHLIDGQTYEIPRGVARHLNNDGWYPEYEYTPGGKMINVPGGQPTNMRIGKKVHRFAFQIIDDLDDAEAGEVQSGLVFAEFVGNQNLVQR